MAHQPATATARPGTWLIFAITVTGITGNTLITPSLPEIVAGVGARPGQAGLVIAATTLPGIVLAPVIGVLADRFGRREVLVPCLVVFGIAGGLAGAAPSLGLLLVARFLQGAGSAGLINLAVVLIGDYWRGADRATMIGRNAAVLTVCLAVFPLLGGGLTDLGGWRAPFFAYPFALFTAWLLARGLPPTETERPAVTDQLRGTLPVLRQRVVIGALGAGLVTFALIFGLLLTVLPIHLEQAFGVRPSVRGLVLGLPALANTAVALSLGKLQWFSKRAQLTAATVLFVVALAGAGVAPSLVLLVTAIAVFGAGEGLMIANLQDIAAGSTDASSRGTVVALFVSAARAGQTVGPVIAGAALSAAGAPATFVVGAGIAAVLLLPLVQLGHGHETIRAIAPPPPPG